MVSFKNGILKIAYEGESKAKMLYEIAFFLNIVTIFVFNKISGIGPIMGVALLFASVLIFMERRNRTVTLPYNLIWFSLVIVYTSISCLWSQYVVSGALGGIFRFIVILMIVTSITIYIDDMEDLEKIMMLFIFAVFVDVSIEMIYTPVSNWFDSGMGAHISDFNANEIAFWAVCAEMMAFYKAYVKNQKGYYLIIVLFIFFAIISGSRKATVASILGPIALIVLSTYKKNYFLKILLVVGAAVGVGYIIMTNESLYNSIGRRFMSMRNYFSDDTLKSDNSLTLRKYYIDVAKDLFFDSPVVGKGMGNFAQIIAAQYGARGAYAHNNYWQILSEYGLIGFALYYSFYAYIIAKLARNFIVQRSKIAMAFIVIMLLLVGLEWGMVTINIKSAQIVIAIAYAATYADVSDGRVYEYIADKEDLEDVKYE